MVKFIIQRPIAVLMTTLAILILGLMASGQIPVSLMPDIDIPEITVQVDADDMSARELEDAVVSRMRRELMQVNYLEDLRSETSNGNAVIKLDLAYGTDIDYSFVEVNEKIDRAMAYLPRDIKRPRVIKASASDVPVFYLNLTLRGTKATGKNGRVNQ